jgi:uncharacterized protein YbaP (TraB family)
MFLTRSRALRIPVLLVALVAAGAVAAAQAPPRPAPAASGKGFIWKVERAGRVGWLVGSLHLGTPDFYPLPPSMEAAFVRADALVEEIDIREAAGPEFTALVLSKALNPAGTTLATQLSKETYDRVNAWFTNAGIGLALFQQMKPWMVAITLQSLALQRIGFNPEHGIDKHFQDAAVAAGKRFIALETAAEQIEMLDGMSAKTQDLMLRESVESADTEQSEIKAIAAAWRAGDAAAVERIALAGLTDAPEVYRTMLLDRNRRWVPKIESCVQTSSCFVVVGAAHLVGPMGLIDLLKQKGYSVVQE